MVAQGWGRPFEDPIKVGGRKLVTLRDAGEYIAGLPKAEHDAPEWQAAVEALILVAESGGPTVFVYVNTGKQAGDKDHIKVFATQDAAEKWFEENDPEGVAFEYEVLE